MSKAALHKRDTVHRFALWALITVELLMSFSFLGYIHVEPISITPAYIPVLLAGALLGPADSAILGLVFGLASMWKASANSDMEADHLFSPLFSGYPLGSIMLSVGSRTLFGLAAGLLYDLAKKLRPSLLWVGVISFVGKTIHSFMVYGAMALFFPEAGYGPADAFSDMLHLQIQFLFGIVSLMVLVILFLIVNRLYNSHMALEGKLDPLTGLRSSTCGWTACSMRPRAWDGEGM